MEEVILCQTEENRLIDVPGSDLDMKQQKTVGLMMKCHRFGMRY